METLRKNLFQVAFDVKTEFNPSSIILIHGYFNKYGPFDLELNTENNLGTKLGSLRAYNSLLKKISRRIGSNELCEYNWIVDDLIS